jgi:hypothetical protein
MKTYLQLTPEEQQRALVHERAALASKLRDYLLGNNRGLMPPDLQPIIDAFEASVLSRARRNHYLKTEAQRNAVRID